MWKHVHLEGRATAIPPVPVHRGVAVGACDGRYPRELRHSFATLSDSGLDLVQFCGREFDVDSVLSDTVVGT